MTDDDERPSPYTAFWLDVLKQTISGVLVAVVVYLGAILLGYLSAPPIRDLVMFIIALFLPGPLLMVLLERRVQRKRTPWWLTVLIIVVAGGCFAFGVWKLLPSIDTMPSLFP